MNSMLVIGPLYFAPLVIALIIDLVWMGLALGAVLRKVGLPSWQAFVPVLRWMAAAQAARMSRLAVGLARGIALAGAVAAVVGLGVYVDQVDAAPAWARLALVVGSAVNVLGSLAGWVLWIYGSGTIELRLRAPAALSWVAAVSPPIWASIMGWGPYNMGGRTDDAARRASAPSDAPIRSSAVDASSFATGPDAATAASGWATPEQRAAQAPSPYAPPVAASASEVPEPFVPDAPAPQAPAPAGPEASAPEAPAPEAPAPEAPAEPAPVTGSWAAVITDDGTRTPSAPSAPVVEPRPESEPAGLALPWSEPVPEVPAPATGEFGAAEPAATEPAVEEPPAFDTAADAPESVAAPNDTQAFIGSLPPGWAAGTVEPPAPEDAVMPRPTWASVTPPEPEVPVRVSPFAPPEPAAPPADLRPLSAPSADDVPTLSAPSLEAASAAIPLVTAADVVPVPEPETAPEAQSEPEPETAPEPELAVTDAAAAEPAAETPAEPAAEPVGAEEPPADTFALSPYLTARRTAADAEGESDAAVDAAPERATEPPAVTASVSPYGAGPVDDAAEPDWLVEARRQAQASAPQSAAEETPAPAPAAAPTPLPRVEAANDALITTAVLAPVPPAPVEAPDPAEADADDRTVIATRRRTVWRLKVGTDTYDLPDSAVIIGRATASAAADRIGIADATRTMSKVHAR
ncbi:MAG: hypothetical protein ACK5IM_14545, partial [Demequina sp.]